MSNARESEINNVRKVFIDFTQQICCAMNNSQGVDFVIVAQWLWAADRNRLIPRRIYEKFCESAFPAYICNYDSRSSIYWEEFVSCCNNADTSLNIEHWPLLIEFYKDHSGITQLSKEITMQRVKLMNPSQAAYCELVAQNYIKMNASKTLASVRPHYCTETRLLARLIATDNINANFIDVFIKPINHTGSPIMYEEAKAVNGWYADLGQAIARDPTYRDNKMKHRQYGYVRVIMAKPRIDYSPGICFRPKCTRYVQIELPKSRADVKILNHLFPYTSEVDKHHMVTNIASLVFRYLNPTTAHIDYDDISISRRLKEVNNMFRHIAVGTNQVLVCTIFMIVMGHKSSHVVVSELLERGVLLMKLVDQQEALKAISTAVRRTQKRIDERPLSAIDVSALAYYDLAFGRSEMVTDWENEIKIRCTDTYHLTTGLIKETPKLVNNEIHYDIYYPEDDKTFVLNTEVDEVFYIKLKHHLKEQLKIIMPAEAQVETFKEFCSRRHEWSVSGSSGGFSVAIPKASALFNRNKFEDKDLVIKGDKRAVFEAITINEMVSFLDPTPEEDALASEKHENGKRRAIYGVGLVHYVICSYVTHGFEERMSSVEGFEKGLSGIKEFAAQQQQRANICANSRNECTMLDYADFNIQHSPHAMALIVEAMIEIGEERGYSDDWMKAAEWLRQSKFNMTFRCPFDNNVHHVKQGLFSGVRTTDFDNSNLNRAYFKVAEEIVAERYKCHPDHLLNVHQGDDVWLSNTKRHWAALIYYQLAASGAVLRGKKQMLGKSFGEFLRVLYHSGGGIGYAVRSIVNYILRPIQNKRVDNVQAMCQSLHDTYKVLQRRGMTQHFLNGLYDTDMLHWAQVKAHSTDTSPITLPIWIIQADTTAGGFGCSRPGTYFTSEINLPPSPTLHLKQIGKKHSMPQHMTNDWISFVSTKLPEGDHVIQSNKLRHAMFQTNYFKVLNEIGYGADLQVYKTEWSKYLRNNQTLGKSALFVQNQAFRVHIFTSLKDFKTIERTLCGNTMASLSLEYPKQLLNFNIYSPLRDRTERATHLRVMMEKLFVKSIFKDINMTASALGLEKHLAAAWIYEHCLTSEQAQSPDMLMVYQMMKQPHGGRLIEFLTKNSFGQFNFLSGFLSPNLILECVRMAKEMLILDYQHKEFAKSEHYNIKFNMYCYQLIKLFTTGSIINKPILF